jgi:glycerophosphoryl diester phosphodiesterase
MKYRVLLLFIVLFPGLLFAQSSFPHSRNKCVVIAHRGDHTQAPENTLKSFEDAIAIGADYVEIDLRTSRDGRLVIMHDASVDRMTNGKGKVNELSFSELHRLKIRNPSDPESGFYIPTLTETLQLCKDRIQIYLDFKDADVTVTWDLIRRNAMEKSVVVYINNELQYQEWRKVAPSIPLMVSLPDSVTNVNTLERFLNHVDAELLDGYYAQYTKEMVEMAQSKGRMVWADIQQPEEGPELWEKAIKTHLHGLQSDHPGKLIQFLVDRNLR